MSTDCGACWAKYLLFFFNFLFFIVGLILLAAGIWITLDKSSFIEATKFVNSSDSADELREFTQPNVTEQWSYFFIAIGALIFIISFLGYCGAIKESRCLLTSYGIILIILLVIGLTATGLILGYKDKAEDKTREIFKYTIKNYYSVNDKRGVTVMWNSMMTQLKCCGVDNYHDFDDSQFRKNGNKSVPDECCVMVKDPKDSSKNQPKDPNCPYQPTEANSYYMKGCYDSFMHLLLDNAKIAIIVGFVLGVLELLGIFLAFCLCKTIDRYFK